MVIRSCAWCVSCYCYCCLLDVVFDIVVIARVMCLVLVARGMCLVWV